MQIICTSNHNYLTNFYNIIIYFEVFYFNPLSTSLLGDTDNKLECLYFKLLVMGRFLITNWLIEQLILLLLIEHLGNSQ